VLLEGPLIDLLDRLIPCTPAEFVPRLFGLLAGILLTAFGIALYVRPRLGAGPPEAVMPAIHRRGEIRLGFAKLLLDGLCVLAGWRLGGNVGVDTVLAAALVGPLVDAVLSWMGRFRP
jgi:uncharacterized membrane protein YczE